VFSHHYQVRPLLKKKRKREEKGKKKGGGLLHIVPSFQLKRKRKKKRGGRKKEKKEETFLCLKEEGELPERIPSQRNHVARKKNILVEEGKRGGTILITSPSEERKGKEGKKRGPFFFLCRKPLFYIPFPSHLLFRSAGTRRRRKPLYGKGEGRVTVQLLLDCLLNRTLQRRRIERGKEGRKKKGKGVNR